ncbi:MAG: right-handed parallel beta-helix repeat-containing protein [Candidatus Moraniibacteriota bacterium]
MYKIWPKSFLRILFFTSFFGVLFFTSSIVLADDYDIYVDTDHDGEEKGTEDEPFNSIKDALKEAEAEDLSDIYIKEGTYEGDLVVEESVNFIGEDKNEVIIEGDIEANDDFKAEKLTLKGSVVIEGDSDLELKDCKVKDFSGIGIEALEGDGKVEVEDCEVSGEGKGFYIMRGREIRIENNDIHHNIGEEAVDLRAELSGIIKDNKIHNNGESGIEVIVGEADLEIIGNDIEDSGSSAIATQFYPDWEDKGKIVIKDNTLEDSDNYGIDCKRPQGGSGGDNYFRDSLEVSDNEIQDNDKGDIADYCGLDKEEEKPVPQPPSPSEAKKENANTNSEENKDDSGEQVGNGDEDSQENISEEEKRDNEKEKELEKNRERVRKEKNILLDKQSEEKQIFLQEKKQIKNKNAISVFFLGPSYQKIEEAENKIKEMEDNLVEMKELQKQALSEEDKKEIGDQIKESQSFIEENKNKIKDQEDRFSLFGWLVKWFS